MKSRLEARVVDLADRHPRLAAAGRSIPTVLGVCVVWVAVAVLVGYGLGHPAPAGPPPAVDFGDDPAQVVADASERLAHRNYTVESWERTVDYRQGSVSGGMFYRLYVEPARGQIRGFVQPAGQYGGYSFLDDGPPGELFAADGAAWVRPGRRATWHRSPPAAALAADAVGVANWSRTRLADANLTVVADNETRYVAETTDAPAVDFEDVGRVAFVVAKGGDPHLREVRFVHTAPTGQSTRLVRVVNDGETVAARPPELPPRTFSEVASRIDRGWGRLPP